MKIRKRWHPTLIWENYFSDCSECRQKKIYVKSTSRALSKNLEFVFYMKTDVSPILEYCFVQLVNIKGPSLQKQELWFECSACHLMLLNISVKFHETRAGVYKTLCPQLPNSNTAWLQHCLPMMVATVQIYEISMFFYQKGNNSKPEIAKGHNSNISFNWFKYQGSGLNTFWDILLTWSKMPWTTKGHFLIFHGIP